MATSRLTAGAARRIALAAQGFAEPRPTGAIEIRHIRKVVARVGLLQLDSVNVFCRSHYLPVFSRLGPYRRELLDGLAAHGEARGGRPLRELFEYWGHEASLLPLGAQPRLRWRMARADTQAWSSVAAIARENPVLVEEVFALVAERGPIRASDTGLRRPRSRPGQMWNWHAGKIALEYLFYAGRVAAAGRVNFERLYDLPERVLPAAILDAPTPAEPDAQRDLVRIAARALGVATEPDLGDYFRLPRPASKLRVAELVGSGELVPVSVEGWQRAGLPLERGPPPPARLGPGPALPLRLPDLVPGTYRTAVWLPLSHRDLYPGRQACPRLLRGAFPPGRLVGGPGGSQVRTAERDPARTGRLRRARSRPPGGGSSAGGRAARGGDVVGTGRGRRRPQRRPGYRAGGGAEVERAMRPRVQR